MTKPTNPGFRSRGVKFNKNNPNVKGFRPYQTYVEKPLIKRLFKPSRKGNIVWVYVDGTLVELTRNNDIYRKEDNVHDSIIYQLLSDWVLIKDRFNVKLDIDNRTVTFHKNHKSRLSFALRVVYSLMERKNFKDVTVMEITGFNPSALEGPGVTMPLRDFKRIYGR